MKLDRHGILADYEYFTYKSDELITEDLEFLNKASRFRCWEKFPDDFAGFGYEIKGWLTFGKHLDFRKKL